MSDFQEMAWEEGFSDSEDYLEHLMNEASKGYSDYDDEYYADEGVNKDYPIVYPCNSQKHELMKEYAFKKAVDNGYELSPDFITYFVPDYLDNKEVKQNIINGNLKPGDILEIRYSSKNEINKYHQLFNKGKKQFVDEDDVYFVKKVSNLDLFIWVGSPMRKSKEKTKIINQIKRHEEIPYALVTTIKNKYQYTYSIVVINIHKQLYASEEDSAI